LSGTDAPLEARVVALCDTFDALTHDRPWRRALPLPSALSLIRENAGSQFDPALSERFTSWVQDELLKVDDFEVHLAAEAAETVTSG
jgi:HD-GYP domain-containing protein (c-di-GMP phosphodiesterase class II)